MGAAPTHAERTGTPRDREGRANAVGIDGGAGRVDGVVDAEIFTARTLGLEAQGNGADEAGVREVGRRDEDVEIGLAPRQGQGEKSRHANFPRPPGDQMVAPAQTARR